MLLNVNEFFWFFFKTMSDTGTLYILDTPGSHSTCRKTNRIPYTSQVGLEEIWWGMFCFLLLERDLIIFYKTGLTMYFLNFFALYLIYLHCKILHFLFDIFLILLGTWTPWDIWQPIHVCLDGAKLSISHNTTLITVCYNNFYIQTSERKCHIECARLMHSFIWIHCLSVGEMEVRHGVLNTFMAFN